MSRLRSAAPHETRSSCVPLVGVGAAPQTRALPSKSASWAPLRHVAPHTSDQAAPRATYVVAAYPILAESPYQQLLHRALAARGMRIADAGPLRVSRALVPDMDVVHVHWLEYLLGSNDREPQKPARMLARGVRLLAALTALRARGVRVVWTVHNLTPHDAPPTYRAFSLRRRARRPGIRRLQDDCRVPRELHWALPPG
jgi:hypothetical protein